MTTSSATKKIKWGQGSGWGKVTIKHSVKLSPDIFPQAAAGDSKTVTFGDAKLMADGNTVLADFPSSSIVIYRAVNNAGGVEAYIAITINATSDGWYTTTAIGNGGMQVVVTLGNAQNAPIYQITMPTFDVRCGDNNATHFYQTAIDPNLFDLTEGMGWSTPGGNTWRKC